MRSAKVNIYISYTGEDRHCLQKLLRWLHPMRDEVNIWFYNPPPPLNPLSLPWQILLFWYTPPNPMSYYLRTLHSQFESAHLYLFLTSYRTLTDARVGEEITAAVNRHIEYGDKFVRVYPVVVSPSQWKIYSRLARFKTLGPKKPLNQIHPEEEGYLELTEQISKEVKALQRNLDELQFAREQPGDSPHAWPPLLGQAKVYPVPEAVSPPEWMGWVVIAVLLLSVYYSLSPSLSAMRDWKPRYEYLQRPPEYQRQNPLAPPPPGTPMPGQMPLDTLMSGQ